MAVPDDPVSDPACARKGIALRLDGMRTAIDRYKDLCDEGKIQATSNDSVLLSPEARSYSSTACKMRIQASAVLGKSNNGKLAYYGVFTKDPMTGERMGNAQHAGYPGFNTWGGQDVFDVYTKPRKKAAMERPIRSGEPRTAPRICGFTLIELMIVMAIVSILLAIAVPDLPEIDHSG